GTSRPRTRTTAAGPPRAPRPAMRRTRRRTAASPPRKPTARRRSRHHSGERATHQHPPDACRSRPPAETPRPRAAVSTVAWPRTTYSFPPPPLDRGEERKHPRVHGSGRLTGDGMSRRRPQLALRIDEQPTRPLHCLPAVVHDAPATQQHKRGHPEVPKLGVGEHARRRQSDPERPHTLLDDAGDRIVHVEIG